MLTMDCVIIKIEFRKRGFANVCVSLRKGDLGGFVRTASKQGGFWVDVAVYFFLRAKRGN